MEALAFEEERVNRSWLETVAHILTLTQNGAKKSYIAFGARLNNPRATRLIRSMLDAGLLAEVPSASGGSLFVATRKGFEFLHHFDALLGALKPQPKEEVRVARRGIRAGSEYLTRNW